MNARPRTVLHTIAALTAAIALVGCGGGGGEQQRILSVLTMEPANLQIAVGETRTITATGRDQFGDPIDCTVTWRVEGEIGDCAPTAAKASSHSTEFTATASGTGAVVAESDSVSGRCPVTVTEEEPAPEPEPGNLFFLHHSTGNGFVEEGGMRDAVGAYNVANGTEFELWDHGYNGEGLRNAQGVWTGTSYTIPGDNTDPDGLHTLWTTDNDARRQILANHEVIAFKSCFPASAIGSAGELEQYRQYYREMRDFFDTRTDRLFVVMSTPPLHRLSTNVTEADNARAFADWLNSDAYLAGHPNVVCYDLFDHLAHPDDESDAANMLRYAYEQSHNDGDSHPNLAANEVIGPSLAQFMMDAAQAWSP